MILSLLSYSLYDRSPVHLMKADSAPGGTDHPSMDSYRTPWMIRGTAVRVRSQCPRLYYSDCLHKHKPTADRKQACYPRTTAKW